MKFFKKKMQHVEFVFKKVGNQRILSEKIFYIYLIAVISSFFTTFMLLYLHYSPWKASMIISVFATVGFKKLIEYIYICLI
jgi:hypothetical protein